MRRWRVDHPGRRSLARNARPSLTRLPGGTVSRRQALALQAKPAQSQGDARQVNQGQEQDHDHH